MSQAARSLYFPEINLGPTANRSKSRFFGAVAGSTIQDNFIVPVDFSYEVDVWGKVRRQVESASASAQAAGETLTALRLSVAGEVAQTYWALRAVDADRVVLEPHLGNPPQGARPADQAPRCGQPSAASTWRAPRPRSPPSRRSGFGLDQDRIGLVNALAVLAGATATGFAVADQADLPKPPSVPGSVPSELLRQRPDIRAAERRVAAANADIGVATAAFYPSFSINANGALSAARLAICSRRRPSSGRSGPKPRFPSPAATSSKAQQQAAVAAHEAVSADYRQTVLESIREVENALQGAAILERRQTAQDQALAAARKTFELSVKRFESGLVSFLDVVDAERTRLDTERAANAVRAERLAVSVSLIKALGGEW